MACYHIPSVRCSECMQVDAPNHWWGKYAPKGKCDICGSTAVDHTEMQCQINRQLKRKK